jgi:hypothetical protein
MKRILDHLRAHIHESAGVVDSKTGEASLRELELTEWSREFEALMRNRMISGAMRYGRLGAPGKPQYDRVDDMIARMKRYEATGNDELLVDIANMAMLEFVEGIHPRKHFHGSDDGPHTSTF